MNRISIVDFAENNNVQKIQELLDAGEEINQFEYNRSALHAACISNAIDAAKILIKRGIDVNLKDKYSGDTPLHYCAVYNSVDIATMIIDNGGKLEIADNYGNQPLWTAVFNVKGKEERLRLVSLYLSKGADRNHRNNVGKSPYDFAMQVKYSPLIDLLQSK